jgi:hypothetical protein
MPRQRQWLHVVRIDVRTALQCRFYLQKAGRPIDYPRRFVEPKGAVRHRVTRMRRQQTPSKSRRVSRSVQLKGNGPVSYFVRGAARALTLFLIQRGRRGFSASSMFDWQWTAFQLKVRHELRSWRHRFRGAAVSGTTHLAIYEAPADSTPVARRFRGPMSGPSCTRRLWVCNFRTACHCLVLDARPGDAGVDVVSCVTSTGLLACET